MKYIIANWKMNMDLASITSWIAGYKKVDTQNKVIIAASFLHLPLLSEFAKSAGIELASQDVSTLDKGAHTGEVGAFQIKQFCNYSIVGHSERHEPIDVVLKKRDMCLANKITPIICFVSPEDAVKLYTPGVLLAWEVPNNISVNGQYREKDPAEIETGIKNISDTLPKDIALIYGGSVNRNNVENLTKIAQIGGALPGNASLDPQHFIDIIDAYAKAE